MIRFKQYINESFKNAIGPNDPLKQKYVDQVWQLLQQSYAPIGGLKGSGFESKQSMIEKIPFWKLAVKDGIVHAVVLYKDKSGRKSVALASDGSSYAKRKIADIAKNDIDRAYGEKSKALLGFVLKQFPRNVIEPYLHTPQQAANVLKKHLTPIKDLPQDQWPTDAKFTLQQFPWLIQYGYIREIGGKPTFKVMIGTPGKKIR